MPELSLKLPDDWYQLHLESTDSTMLQLRKPELLAHEKEFVLVTTDYQTAGRGQKGTSWEADAGANLLFGLTFHPSSVPASRQFALSEILALAVADALRNYADDISIKWPNDIYWKDRKICGMLLEHDLCGNQISTTLTGVGLNVNQAAFHSDAPNPVSLRQIVGHDINRDELLLLILQLFTAYYRHLQAGLYDEIHQTYMDHLYRRHGLYTYQDDNGTFRARIVDISPLGVLTLLQEDGTEHSYAFKEVSYII